MAYVEWPGAAQWNKSVSEEQATEYAKYIHQIEDWIERHAEAATLQQVEKALGVMEALRDLRVASDVMPVIESS